MFENQIQKKRAARKGNQRAAIFGVEVAAGDRVLGHVVGDLDRGLHPVRLLLHAARDPDHRDDRQDAGQQQVEDRLVDAEVDAAEFERDPGLELELVLGLEVFVFAGAAEDQQHQDRDREVGAEADEDFGFGASAPLCRSGRLVAHAPSPSGSPNRWASPWAAKETVKRTASRTRRGEARPRARPGRPAAPRSPSARPDRGSRADDAHRPLAVAGRQFAADAVARRAPGRRAGRARRRRRRRSRAAAGHQAGKPRGRRPAPVGRRTWEET